MALPVGAGSERSRSPADGTGDTETLLRRSGQLPIYDVRTLEAMHAAGVAH
jgi:hypothetical protein